VGFSLLRGRNTHFSQSPARKSGEPVWIWFDALPSIARGRGKNIPPEAIRNPNKRVSNRHSQDIETFLTDAIGGDFIGESKFRKRLKVMERPQDDPI
jgi:hypothetical protein